MKDGTAYQVDRSFKGVIEAGEHTIELAPTNGVRIILRRSQVAHIVDMAE